METSPCHNSVAGHQIATSFCTWPDSTAVVPCTKFCSDHWIRIDVRVKRNFHRIWIAMKKPLVKRVLLSCTRGAASSVLEWQPAESGSFSNITNTNVIIFYHACWIQLCLINAVLGEHVIILTHHYSWLLQWHWHNNSVPVKHTWGTFH